MIAYAAMDLRGGRVVQLVGGRPEAERVSLPDPAAVAAQWLGCGFAALHVVDLDAALGQGDNRAAVDVIIRAAAAVPVQVGGGIRSSSAADALLRAGAARVVVGTRAVEDRPWLERLAARWPGRVVVAADVRGEEVVIRGWTEGAGVKAEQFLTGASARRLAGVLVTDVAREGRDAGSRCSDVPAAGRRQSAPADRVWELRWRDLRELAATGVAGVVLGMALYTGALDAAAIATRYAKLSERHEHCHTETRETRVRLRCAERATRRHRPAARASRSWITCRRTRALRRPGAAGDGQCVCGTT
jgi:phosphoribosylformimino-5-aminoimidazole carboxamide ribotide isomerase